MDFSLRLPDRLAKSPKDTTIEGELQSNINTLRASGCLSSTSCGEELDCRGTELWNLSTRHSRQPHHTPDVTLCLLRVFAFCLLHSHQNASERRVSNNVRIFKVANKAAKSCLDAGQVGLGQRVLESAAVCEEVLLSASTKADEDLRALLQRLRAEYLTLKIALVYSLSIACRAHPSYGS